MTFDDKTSTEIMSQNVTIEGRRKIIVTGVREVGRFDEEEILLVTESGELVVHGENFHMERFSLDTGEVVASGHVVALEYETEAPSGGGLFSRLFR